MKVLVAIASRHGSTVGIGEAIAAELRVQGFEVDRHFVDEAEEIEGYDAVIVGSAVYTGNWLPAGRRFVETRSSELRTRPVWAFSTGPLSPDAPLQGGRIAVDGVLASAGAREHRVFAGALDMNKLGFSERTAARAVNATPGDYRDWPAIREWARSIAAELRRAAE